MGNSLRQHRAPEEELDALEGDDTRGSEDAFRGGALDVPLDDVGAVPAVRHQQEDRLQVGDEVRPPGVDGLKDRSRRPTSCPHRTDERCEAELVEERRKHPTWGARKLLARLRRRHPDWPWPAASTATAVLKRHSLVTPRKLRHRRPAPGKPSVEAAQPNDVWTADFKGEFRVTLLSRPLLAAGRSWSIRPSNAT